MRIVKLCMGLLLGMSLVSASVGQEKSPPAKVDYSYAFATPHRITAGRPDASDRTLLDLQPGSLRMAWTYDNLAMPQYPLNAFKTPKTDWDIRITPQIDGHAFKSSRWARLDGMLPGLENVYDDSAGGVRLEAMGGLTAAVIRVEVAAADSQPHQVILRCESARWGENPAWVDPAQYAGDNLVAGWNERADRVLILGLAADAYSLAADGQPPSPRSMTLVWKLKPGEKRVGWIVRPYRAYAADLPALRKHDWAQEMAVGRREWHDLLGRATKLSVPDEGVTNGYLACLADLFIMREPAIDGYLGAAPGTETYRAHNPAEAGIVAIALDQNGFHRESANGYRISLDAQEPDGDWNDHQGWCHLVWFGSGFKSWVAIEHYRLTHDRKYLADVYPRMLASSRWQERQRTRTRRADGDRPLTDGLMPRGFGDCGVKDGNDLYGQFIPHNIWAVYADRVSWEVAEILGKVDDSKELKKIYQTARRDLLTAIERGAIQEKGYRWIPGVAGKTTGSRWGVLNISFPCGLLAPDHELVTGTLRHIESHLSPGGIPVNTGWLTNGMWVAITLDNVAEVQLQRGNGDAAARYLYATLNHGTPLYTWCEERGQEPGSAKCTGDRQHLWTPVAVVRALRDMMVMEHDDGLNLALGTAREWLASGKPVGIAAAPTHFGPVSYQMQYDAAGSGVSGEVKFSDRPPPAWAKLYIRLPGGLKVKSVNADSGAVVEPDGSGIRWKTPQGTKKFHVVVGIAFAEKPSEISFGAAPKDEALLEHYRLTVNGQTIPVLGCRVSAMPFNQVWPGYQRPLDQTELAGFASWDMGQPVQVEVESLRAVESAVVRPTSLGIKPAVEGHRIRFTLARPGTVVVEVNGRHHALHLFANPPAPVAPAAKMPGLHYFGPGVHRPGRIELKSNESVYIAAGAVVYGTIQAYDAINLHVWGRGVLDASELERSRGAADFGPSLPGRSGAMRFRGCSNVTVEGLVLRDPAEWCLTFFGCSRVDVANVKLVGLWRYNADGIDICNSQDVAVHDSFVRAFDDALVVKGLKSTYDSLPLRNICFNRCIVWCDWGSALEIGAETCAPEIRHIQYQDCDIIRSTHVAMRINHGDRAAIRDIRYENVRVEVDSTNPHPRLQKARGETYPGGDQENHIPALMTLSIHETPWMKDNARGTARDVCFKDIQVFGVKQPSSSFRGFDSQSDIDGVTIDNLRFNGRTVSNAGDARLGIGAHVKNVRFAVKE